ncbi:unnamed protein product [Rotaria magnacalcarata]
MISTEYIFLILVYAPIYVNGICSSQIGPLRTTECSLVNNFNTKQWNTCLTNIYIQQQSQGRHRCGDETVRYCNYPCMHEVYYLEANLVIDPCACNDSSTLPESALPTECLSPDGSDCDWYKNCLERKYSCQGTPTEHMTTYAKTFCELHTKHNELLSDRAQRWIDDARKCLQMALVPFVRPFNNGNCQKIRERAFDSYKPCYIRPYPEVASICHMTRRDWLRIFWTLKSAFIASTPIAYSSLQNIVDTFNECSMDTEANDFGHIFKEFKLTIDLIDTPWDNLNKDQSDQIAVRIAHQIARIALAPPQRWGWYAYGIPLTSMQHSHTGHKQMAIELLVADLPGIVNKTLVPPVNITNVEFNEIISRIENAVIKGNLLIQIDNGTYYVSQMTYCLDAKCYATTENYSAPPYIPKNGSNNNAYCFSMIFFFLFTSLFCNLIRFTIL